MLLTGHGPDGEWSRLGRSAAPFEPDKVTDPRAGARSALATSDDPNPKRGVSGLRRPCCGTRCPPERSVPTVRPTLPPRWTSPGERRGRGPSPPPGSLGSHGGAGDVAIAVSVGLILSGGQARGVLFVPNPGVAPSGVRLARSQDLEGLVGVRVHTDLAVELRDERAVRVDHERRPFHLEQVRPPLHTERLGNRAIDIGE